MLEFAKIHLFRKQKEFGDFFWDYVVNIEKMKDYYKEHNNDVRLNEILSKSERTETDEYLLKNILQNDYALQSFIVWKQKSIERLNKKKKLVFDFLDSVDNPYQFIFTPIWFNSFKRYEKDFYPYQRGGVNKITIFVAGEYAKHKLNA